MDQERIRNRSRYIPPEYIPEEQSTMTAIEIDEYNHETVKKLVYFMYAKFCNGYRVIDYGSVQYKYLAMWGVIDLDDYQNYVQRAEIIDRAELGVKFKWNPQTRQENIEAIAKLISVTDFYQRVKDQGITIQSVLNA